ncbi:Fasciclin domain-containing protein [Pyronema omphalodes]|nr:Fasciclin domain-containing protein [Pyronema omphalodes]
MQLSKQLFTLVTMTCLALTQAADPTLLDLLTSDAGKDLSMLTETVKTADLLDTVSKAKNVTILAPNNDAFKAFVAMPRNKDVSKEVLQQVLTYHVIEGTVKSKDLGMMSMYYPTMLKEGQFRMLDGMKQVVTGYKHGDSMIHFNGGLGISSMVTKGDIMFDGGVIHIIDKVLPPPMNISLTAEATNMTKILGAIKKAKLADTLDKASKLTVFVPNDMAFDNIASVVNNATIESLTSILKYHVVEDVVAYSAGLKDMEVKAMDGKTLRITVGKDDKGMETVMVNGAKVVMADVLTSNGVIHVIDQVLNPDNMGEKPDPTKPSKPAFPGASNGTASIPENPTPPKNNGAGKMGVSSIAALIAGVFAFGIVA